MTREQHAAIIAFINQALQCDSPMDVEADAIIRAMFVRQPDAAYRVTMLAMKLAEEAELQPGPENAGKSWFSGLLEKAIRP